ncbi:hypothetical protein FE257_006035 [Aspergillus nanangensis]|uniref:Uncharacterized protein n=1 Tax=Aspergillus nanangensis TaxID=2582783 RepID=A0AAD4GWC0_ASPNN|nr:hypothetical protein FE257_006035 [Aspergillus nanangensis]
MSTPAHQGYMHVVTADSLDTLIEEIHKAISEGRRVELFIEDPSNSIETTPFSTAVPTITPELIASICPADLYGVACTLGDKCPANRTCDLTCGLIHARETCFAHLWNESCRDPLCENGHDCLEARTENYRTGSSHLYPVLDTTEKREALKREGDSEDLAGQVSKRKAR